MKKTWYQQQQQKERSAEKIHHKPAPQTPAPWMGTPAWLLELIAIIEKILPLLPTSSPESEARKAELAAAVARLQSNEALNK